MAAPKKYPDELCERAVRLYRESDPKPRRGQERTHRGCRGRAAEDH